jgi:hypothetical protein
MATAIPRLARVDLPDFGAPGPRPELPGVRYSERVAALRAVADARGYDRLVVYADREHSANLSFLTGFDPRFEEAMLVLGPDDPPAILVGNECWGTAGAAPLAMERHLFQDFSLPEQPRDRSLPLGDILEGEGIRPSGRVGVIGWKPFRDRTRIEIPAFIVDELRDMVGPAGVVENANDLMVDPQDGLRILNDVDQIAGFEHASTRTSSGVRSLLEGLRPGMTEAEAVALLGWDGTPLSCHVMLTAGPRARFGLLSPSDRPIGRGEPFTTAFGIWGALTCRAGWVAEDERDLPDGVRDYVDRLVAPYFGAVAEWYGALHVGQRGGVLQEIIDRRLADPFFGIFLNPGHQLHLDEWVSSPVSRGSETELRSGMVMQVDIIPATGTPWFTTNIEDGIALADAALRSALETAYPEAWSRIQRRRAFMRDALGIDLNPDVLPLSSLAAALPPFLLRPDRVMTLAS